MWLKSELMLTEVTHSLLPPSEIPLYVSTNTWRDLGIGVDYVKKNILKSLHLLFRSSVCPLHVVICVMPWPVATAILPLVLSRLTITSSHRRARIGGISFSPTGLLFLTGVSLSLSVQHERHLPTQNQNSHYCAAAKRVVKRTRLIWNQFHFCLPKAINEHLFKRLMWIAQMQIKWSCTVSLCQYYFIDFCM